VIASPLPSSPDYELVNEETVRAETESIEHQMIHSTIDGYFPLIGRPPMELPLVYSRLETSSHPAEEGGNLTSPVREEFRANPYYANVINN